MSDVEPPEDDELFQDEQDQVVQEAVQQANQFHQMMDGAKAWARRTALDVRVYQALEEEEEAAEELGEIAGLVESVITRIERGDNNRARQP